MTIDHPIFQQSIKLIQSKLGSTGLDSLQQQVLVRMIHSSGDFEIKTLLNFSPDACEIALKALKAGAPILTDTSMAMAAIKPMALRTLKSEVQCVLEWSPEDVELNTTRTAKGIELAWKDLSSKYRAPRSPIVVIGSAPTALEALLDLIELGAPKPSLIIGMPVGFVGVPESKRRLSQSNFPQINLNGTRGGASLAAAAMNALLRASILL